MVILFDAAKLQQLYDICKYLYNYFYFYGDFLSICGNLNTSKIFLLLF